jgi:ribosomal protein S18 acetylase RimI-like enzyme
MTPALKWRDRLAKPDLDTIYQLVKKTGVFSEEECRVARELAEDRLTRGLNSDYHFMVATVADKITAYTCYGRIPFTDGRFDLYWIACDPDMSYKGIATRLLSISEAHMRELGGKKLYAETSSREVYLPAHQFYEKNGFLRESVFKDFYRDGDSKWVFVKDL